MVLSIASSDILDLLCSSWCKIISLLMYIRAHPWYTITRYNKWRQIVLQRSVKLFHVGYNFWHAIQKGENKLLPVKKNFVDVMNYLSDLILSFFLAYFIKNVAFITKINIFWFEESIGLAYMYTSFLQTNCSFSLESNSIKEYGTMLNVFASCCK